MTARPPGEPSPDPSGAPAAAARPAGEDALPLAAAFRATRMPMLLTDPRRPDNPIVFVNDGFLRLTGYARDEVVGRNCRFLQGPDSDPATVARLRGGIAAGEEVTTELLNYRKDGRPFWNALTVTPVRDERGDLVHFFAVLHDVSDKKYAKLELRRVNERLERDVERRTRDLTEALEQKTVLLHEVDHRVKNNLQLVSSLILLQSRRVPDPEVRRALRDMLERVAALSTVHRRLYQSDDVSRFDVAEFAADLATDLVGASGREDIRLELDLEPVAIPAAKAAPLALVVNELVTNALRHAFPDDRGGRLTLRVQQSGGRLGVTVEDDGVGTGGAPGFGRQLVDLLGRQLRARLAVEEAGPGTRVTIDLPVEGA